MLSKNQSICSDSDERCQKALATRYMKRDDPLETFKKKQLTDESWADLLWCPSSLLSIPHPCCVWTLQWFVFLRFLLRLSILFHAVSHGFFFLSPFLFCLFLFVVVVFVHPPFSSIPVQAAKLQWSLDEKVGSSRGTRVSRHLCIFVSLCWCVANHCATWLR